MTISEISIDNADFLNKVEEIKLKAISTRQTYIDIAKLLFLQYQEMPTANRLYNLVRKGSMTTVVEAMRIFWQDIQNQLSIKMHMPNVPQALQLMLSEQIECIWNKALEQSALEFEKQRQEIMQTNITLENELSNLNTQILEYEGKYQSLDTSYQNLQIQHQQSQEKILAQEAQIQQEQSLQKDLYKKIAQLQIDINENQKIFNKEKAEVHAKFDLNIQALQQDIKIWQQRLDNERTQFKIQEKEFNKQNKVNQDTIQILQDKLSKQEYNSSLLQNKITSLEQKYKELENINITLQQVYKSQQNTNNHQTEKHVFQKIKSVSQTTSNHIGLFKKRSKK